MTPDPETPCVCGQSFAVHTPGGGCEASIRIGGLIYVEGEGLKPGVTFTCCPCRRHVVEGE